MDNEREPNGNNDHNCAPYALRDEEFLPAHYYYLGLKIEQKMDDYPGDNVLCYGREFYRHKAEN